MDGMVLFINKNYIFLDVHICKCFKDSFRGIYTKLMMKVTSEEGVGMRMGH